MECKNVTAPLSKEEVSSMITSCYSTLKAMARRYYNDKDNVLDLVQDTICKVLVSDSLSGVRCKSDLIGLCCLAMRSIRYNDWHTSQRMPSANMTSEDDFGGSCCILDSDAAGEIEIIREAATCDVRVAAALYKAEGYSEKEIAEMQAVPLGTVKSRINAGRKVLRAMR